MNFPIDFQLFADLPRAYLVGGSVRDMLRGVEPMDYDVVVEAEADLFAHKIAVRVRGKVVTLGKDQFNVHRVVSEALTIDVSTIKGHTIEADLKARDFTINALACDLSGGEIIDPGNGAADLKNGIVRMVSTDSFRDDPARLIRAFRMAATMDFHIDRLTLRTITAQANAIKQVAGERIWAEIEQILACPQSLQIVQDLAATQLLFQIVPELHPLMGCLQNQYHTEDVFNHSMSAYSALEDLLGSLEDTLPVPGRRYISQMKTIDRVMIKFAVLLHDIGKPAVRSVDERGRVHFYGHASRGAAISKGVCQRLRTPNRLRNRVEAVIRYHQRPLSLYLARQQSGLRPKSIGRFFRQCGDLTPYILIHAIADDMGKGNPGNGPRKERIRFYHELIKRYAAAATHINRGTIINGHDLMKIFGMPPSPLLGKILNSVKELQMTGVLKTRQQAIEWVSQFIDQEDPKS